MKYEIVCLRAQSHGYKMLQTDYELTAELTADAIKADRDDRWTLIPADYNGRPFKPYT
jgi:hypothetical protein